MSTPENDAEIERLARVAYHEYSRLFAKPLKWDEDTYEADRELWRRVARAVVEAMR
ncbi:MAG: hypothetical protein VYB54_04845 [Pseudomonadota bacterium]|nr:hypothetical protein [Pseudomonadota bacterium]